MVALQSQVVDRVDLAIKTRDYRGEQMLIHVVQKGIGLLCSIQTRSLESTLTHQKQHKFICQSRKKKTIEKAFIPEHEHFRKIHFFDNLA